MITPTFILPVPQSQDACSLHTNFLEAVAAEQIYGPNTGSTRVKSITEKVSRRPSIIQFFEEAVRN